MLPAAVHVLGNVLKTEFKVRKVLNSELGVRGTINYLIHVVLIVDIQLIRTHEDYDGTVGTTRGITVVQAIFSQLLCVSPL